MRLRKTLKRTAAAALALGVAVSSAAPAATATYYCNIREGNVVVKKDDNGVSAKVGDKDATYVDDDKDDVVISDGPSQKQDDSQDTFGIATMDLTEDDYAPEPAEEEDKADAGAGTEEADKAGTEEESKTDANEEDKAGTEEESKTDASEEDKAGTEEESKTDANEEDKAGAEEKGKTDASEEDKPDAGAEEEDAGKGGADETKAGTAAEKSSGETTDKPDKGTASGREEADGSKASGSADAEDDASDAKADEKKESKRAPSVTVTKTDLGTVTEYGKYDVDPDIQIVKPASKSQKTSAKKSTSDDEGTACTSDTSGSQSNSNSGSFIDNIITIINDTMDALHITLENVKIKASNDAAMTVKGSGDVDVELDGKNELSGGYNHAGLEKNADESTGKLTIKDDKNDDGSAKSGDERDTTGSLNATGGVEAAGIGGACGHDGSNITISGGDITATGSYSGAGIGGGGAANGSNITISGGKVNANSDPSNFGGGAGIGGGGGAAASTPKKGLGQNILITGGEVTATGSNGGAGIGGGLGASGSVSTAPSDLSGISTITITGGKVTASANAEPQGVSGAGIGGGAAYTVGTNDSKVTISGTADVKATGGKWAAAIGGGRYGNSDISISGSSTVEAEGGQYAAGIGGGYQGDGKVTISGGKVTKAAGGQYGAGIGGGYQGDGNVTISSGDITAAGSQFGAAIGGGVYGNGTIRISDGKITASAGSIAVAIGGGTSNTTPTATVTITGGDINATGDARGNEAIGNAKVSISNQDSDLTLRANVTKDTGSAITSTDGKTDKELLSPFGELHAAFVRLTHSYDASTNQGTAYHTAHNAAYIAKNDLTLKTDNYLPEAIRDAHQWEIAGTPTPSTCTSTGHYDYVCALCGETASADAPLASHTPGEWTVKTPASCTTDGEEEQTCSVCHEVIATRPIEKLSHKFEGSWVTVKEATCGEAGEKRLYCTNGCGEYLSQEIPATVHTPGEWTVKTPATCTTDGEEEQTCSVCHEVIGTRPIEKLSHKFEGSWVTVKEATCGEAGEERLYCTNGCGEYLSQEIPATGEHSWGKWVENSASGTRTRTCTVCGQTETEPLPASDDDNASVPAGADQISTDLMVTDRSNTNIIRNQKLVRLTQINRVLYIDTKEDTASLQGILLDLSKLMETNVDTVVFSTEECTSTLYLRELVALGADSTQFLLVHAGSSATLTVGGTVHNELIH